MKNKLVWLLILTILFTTSIAGFQTVETHAEVLTISTFLAIAKYAGAGALTVGGGYALYNDWVENTDSSIVSQIHQLQTHLNTGFKVVGSTLYNSIYDYIFGVEDFSTNMPSPSIPLPLGSTEIITHYDTDYRFFRPNVDDLPDRLAVPGYKISNIDTDLNTRRVGVYARVNELASHSSITNFDVFGDPFVTWYIESLSYKTAKLSVEVHGFGSSGESVSAIRSWNYPYSTLVEWGVLEHTQVASFNPSHSISWDDPFWKNKIVEDTQTGEQKIMIPGLPLEWLNAPDTTPLPYGYVHNPGIDFNPDVTHANDVWGGVDTGVINPPADLPADLTGITGLLSSIYNLLTSIFAMPTDFKINFDPLKNLPIAQKFPFCLPFDLKNSIESLQAPAVVPVFTTNWNLPFYNGDIEINLSNMERFAQITRWGTLIIFNLALILVTRKVIS